MSKGPWEERVGMLLHPDRHSEFVYSYKPPDSMHGGQPKIDWHACDKAGRYWLIEVKQLPDGQQSFKIDTQVTPGQRQALDALINSQSGVAMLAVGCGSFLYFYNWRHVRWPSVRSLTLDQATMALFWKGPKEWATLSLYDLARSALNGIPPIQTTPEEQLLDQVPSPSISKPGDSTPTDDRTQPLGRSSSAQARRALYSGSSRRGGRMS